MEEKRKPTPMQIETALAGHIDVSEVAKRMGVTKQAIYKRPDWIKREMGGLKTPAGWLFDPQKLEAYQPLTGRPVEERRPAAPFPVM